MECIKHAIEKNIMIDQLRDKPGLLKESMLVLTLILNTL